MRVSTWKFIIQQIWQTRRRHDRRRAKNGSVMLKVSIVAKAPSPALVNGQNGPPIDIDTLIAMVKNLLVERFKLQTHMEERPINAYTRLSVKPKMKPADPNGRIKCDEGPGLGQKDVREHAAHSWTPAGTVRT